MFSDREKHNTLAATQSRRILSWSCLIFSLWDFIPLSNPIIELLIDHLGDKLVVASEDCNSDPSLRHGHKAGPVVARQESSCCLMGSYNYDAGQFLIVEG